jgi:GNAT superfamily N-acetyltransferase
VNIVPYRELAEKQDLLPLMHLAFGWPFNLKQFEEILKMDPRLNRSSIGFCALEKDQLVGFVGVNELPTKNLRGEKECIGGIWGVATLPSHAKRGISTALMNEAHRYFTERGYKFSFLTTRQTFIAYGFYRKLGYTNATLFPAAYKFLSRTKRPKKQKDEDANVDWRRIIAIYDKSSIDQTGFVVRDERYLRMMLKCLAIQQGKPERVMVGEKGYVFFHEETENSLCIDELIANNDKEAANLIQRIENRAADLIYDRLVSSDRLLRTYKSMGYATQSESYALLMVKELTNHTTFREVYGEKRFCMTSLESF